MGMNDYVKNLFTKDRKALVAQANNEGDLITTRAAQEYIDKISKAFSVITELDDLACKPVIEADKDRHLTIRCSITDFEYNYLGEVTLVYIRGDSTPFYAKLELEEADQ